MAEAGTYACPSCGAPAREQDRHCVYCRCPIATVRCSHCYHMNVPDALHCSGCGWQLGLEPIGQTDSTACPDCELPLEAFGCEAGLLRDCPGCGGQFVEHALLKQLIERREVYGMTAPRHSARDNPLDQPVRYIPCPICKTTMNRKNFGRSSGIIVDICHRHGIWFDPGELPRVLAFVETGGLARARRRELEELERRRRQATIQRAALSAPVMDLGASRPLLLDAEYRAGLLDDAAECAGVLLGALASLLPRPGRSK